MPTPTKPASKATPGKCVVVFGTKGGVGKTVVATNLAVSLAQRVGQPTCLVDLDVLAMGDVARTLKVTTQRSVADLVAMLKRTTPSQRLSLDGFVVSHPSGVHVLAWATDQGSVTPSIDPKGLPELFQALRDRYSYIVVDAGRAFTDTLIAAFDEANIILLVATPDIVTLYQTKWALGVIESLLFPSSMIKLVLNRAESRGGVGSEDVKLALPCEVVGEIPSDGRTVGTSINEGNPLVVAYGSTKVAEAYRRLAEVLTTRQDLYIAHHQIPRHAAQGASVPAGPTMWSSRLYTDDQGIGVAVVEDEIVALKRRIHEQLVEELDLKKLDLTMLANHVQIHELRQKTERVINNLLAREIGGMLTSHEVRARLVKEIADEALGFGPLEELLADPEITDILVNNKDEIYIERSGKLQLTTKKFMSNDQVRTVIERIVAPLGRRIDEANPMVDARLPDGSRVNAIIPPLSIRGPVLSIRKFARERYTLEDLIRFGTIDAAMAQFMRACVLLRKNIIISGGTGSGKTTLLNILSAFIPEGERIITIEDAVELKLAQRHWISLEAKPPNVEGRGQVSVRDLFRNVLRMRPDRIIIGECRGAETLDMLQAMNTGHDGSLTTVHANSPRDVITRLDSMVLMSNIELPIRVIREMVASAIQIMIHTARLSDGSRKVTSVSEIVELVNGTEVTLQGLFQYRQTGVSSDGAVIGEFVATGHRPTFFGDFKIRGIEIPETLFHPPSDSTAARSA